ncbi:MAG: globin domain-containing protein [Gammaproteobacteria bacterium]|nr:globin domain-containing protein [Gammaproteobacteria bacterium]MDH5777640.1 globin domain-containing protein [Gammaproteobacteria bacterium]
MPEHIDIRTDLLEERPQEKDETVLLEKSFAAIAPQGKELVARFYSELFRRAPAVKPMFAGTTQIEQEQKLLAALQLVISNLRNPEQLSHALHSLGVKHQGYGATAEQYDVVAQTMLAVLGEFLGNGWTHEVKNAWANALGTIKQAMLNAYTQEQQPDTKNESAEQTSTRTSSESDLIEKNFAELAPHANDLVARFYDRLFERYPAVKPLFKDSQISEQQKKLVSALKLVVENLRRPTKLERVLKELGKKHQNYGAIDVHYDAVAKTLLDVLKEFSGKNWSGELYTAWFNALQSIKDIMLSGYDEGLDNEKIKLLENSFSALAPHADELVARFYGELFKRYPAVKPMFARVNPAEQKKKLVAALKLVVHNLRNPAKLTTVLKELGKKHQDYGALASHYDAVASTLLDTMADMAGSLWEDDVNDAWELALKTIKEIMLSGYSKR